MDLRRLEYFLAVVEHGSVTSAAAALRVAQPSLSQAIRALERDLGAELFVRDGRGLRPTGAGQALIEPAQRALRDLDSARSAVSEVVELGAGWLDVAAHDLLGRDPLVSVLVAFHERHAGVPVRLHAPRDEEDLIRLVTDGRCELALSYLPVPEAGLVMRRIGTHEVWVVLPPGSPGGTDPMSVQELDSLPVVDSMREFASPRSVISNALRDASVVLRPVVRSRHRESTIPLVLAGLGVTFTTERYAREAAAAGAVIRRLNPSVTCDFALLHRDARLSPAARAFERVLLDVIAGQLDRAGEVADSPETAIGL
jgi:DNA-binding transcriptional LysR family regulator